MDDNIIDITTQLNEINDRKHASVKKEVINMLAASEPIHSLTDEEFSLLLDNVDNAIQQYLPATIDNSSLED